MTDSEAPRSVAIHGVMQRIIQYMLTNPRGEFWQGEIADALKTSQGNISPNINRMVDAGWLESWQGTGEFRRRKFYRFTRGAATMLRKVLND